MSKTRSYHHIVFGTKYRQRTILLEKRNSIYAYITKIVENKKSTLIAINGIEDHIHILLDLHPTIALAEMVKAIKQSSSKRIRETFIFPMFEGWAAEYYACSVSPSHVTPIATYIDNQLTHHKGKNYSEEIVDFVTKMGLQVYKDEI